MAAAISYIFSNAELLQVATEDYSVWGSSAGARMAANIGSHGSSGFGYYGLPKPSTVIMAYTGHSIYTKEDPSTFVVVGKNDQIANPAVMKRRVNALKAVRCCYPVSPVSEYRPWFRTWHWHSGGGMAEGSGSILGGAYGFPSFQAAI